MRLSRLAAELLAEPESRFESCFEEIMKEASNQENKRDALLTATVVLSDILPFYKPTEGTENSKSSKAVKQTLAYENKLQAALKTLVKALKSSGEISGLCALLGGGNPLVLSWVGEQLIGAVVASAGRGDASANEALKKLFESDVELDTTKDVVKEIARERDPKKIEHLVKIVKFARSDLSRAVANSASLQAFQSEKMDEETAAEFRRDLLASSTDRDIAKLRKNEAAILADILVIFVKVIRSHHLYSYDALKVVLDGLKAKASQVNVELMVDIVKELQTLAKDFLLRPKASIEDNELGIMVANTIFSLVGGKEGRRGMVTDLANTIASDVIPRVSDQLALIDSSLLLELVTELSRCGDMGSQSSESSAKILFEALLIQPEASRGITNRLVQLYSRGGEALKANLDREEGGKPSLFWGLWLLGFHVDDVTLKSINHLQEFSNDFPRKKNKITNSESKESLNDYLLKWLSC